MAAEDLDVVVRLKGARAAGAEMKTLSGEVIGMGEASKAASTHTRRMSGVMTSASKSVGGMRARVFGLTGAIGFGAGLGLLGAVEKSSERFRQHQIIVRQTAAVLHSTGRAAHVGAKQIDEMALAIQRKSGFDAEQIMQGENMLLTFTHIRNEAGKGNKIFDRTTKAAADMAAAFQAAGRSMTPTAAAAQLGKALNDPVKGMSRLTRIGVTFTDQQTKQVQALVKTGKTTKAQGIILDALTKKFGGSAAARGNTFQGALDRSRLALLDLGQALFAKVAPYLTKAATAVAKFVTQMQNGTGAGGRFRDRVVAIWNAAKPVVLWFGRAASSVFKFVSHHPALVKVAAALFLAEKALKLMGFAGPISGVKHLVFWLGKAAATKVGAKIAAELASSLAVQKMVTLGTSIGSALGKAIGTAAWPIAVGIIAFEVFKHRQDIMNAVQGHGGPGTISLQDIIAGPMAHPNNAHSQNAIRQGALNATRPRPHPSPSRGGKVPLFAHPGRTTHKVAAAGVGAVDETHIHHTVINLDGKTVWETWDKEDRKKKARR